MTAVPDDGYFFVNWSDGVTSRTRTDSNFKQNLDVTAVFSRASVEIAGEGSGLLGMNYTFTARSAASSPRRKTLHWYVNGVESKEPPAARPCPSSWTRCWPTRRIPCTPPSLTTTARWSANTLTVSFESGIGTGSSSSFFQLELVQQFEQRFRLEFVRFFISSASGSEVEDPSEEVSASSSSSSSSSSGSSGSSSGAGSSSSRPSSSGDSDNFVQFVQPCRQQLEFEQPSFVF